MYQQQKRKENAFSKDGWWRWWWWKKYEIPMKKASKQCKYDITYEGFLCKLKNRADSK